MDIKKYLGITLMCVVSLGLGYLLGSRHQEQSIPRSDVGTVQQSTITVQPKADPASPDTVLNQHYTAIINNKKVEVPIRDVDSKEAATSTGKTSGATDYTCTISQEIDLTPLVKPLVPSWELGIGVGTHDNQFYLPLSIQRNYESDRALCVELHLRGSDIKGVEVQHKWLF